MEQAPEIFFSADTYTLIAFGAYLSLIIGIGVYSNRFSSGGVGEFFIGGRTMNRFVIALSAVVSGRSAWLLLGVSGIAYVRGVSAVWAVAGYIVLEWFLFMYYAPRLRRFSGEYDCITLPDFFSERFEDKNGSLRLMLAGVFILFMVGYVSAQFVAGGKAFAGGFGLSQNFGILLSASIILGYTILGGFLAVSLTDMLQAFFMLFALIAVPLLGVMDAGGIEPILQANRGIEGFFDVKAISFGVLIGFIGIGLGSPGNPHIITRYMAIDDAKQLRFSGWVATGWNIVMGMGAISIGLVGRYYFPEVSSLPLEDTENLFPVLAKEHMHPAAFGIIIASIFAAIMSTADSQLLVAASAWVRDVYQQHIKKGKEIEQNKLVLYSRISIAVLVGLSLLFGYVAQDLVFWLVLFAWAGLGAAIGPTSILALFWRGTTRAGVMAGLATGTVVTIIWYYVPALKALSYELIPAFVAGFLVTWLVSIFTQKPEKTAAYFEAMISGDSPPRKHKN